MAERSYIKGDRPVPDYRLIQFLGKGGFGEVWKATGPGGIEVALKIIPLDNKQGFKEFRAIRMVKNVHNVYLVPIIGFWLKDSNGNLFDDQAESDSFIIKGKATELIIAMGLGEKSLMDRLEECQKESKAGIPSEELLGYMDGAAKAIDFLNRPIHNSGSGQVSIQHCDIKPQNIMIVGGEAQLCDFGLARVLGDPRTTQSGNMMMSVPYTSPEMFEASKPSHSSDQYALAITYVELRTGELPFENPGNPASMMYQIMQGRLDLSRLPDPAEREVIKKATSLDPGKRYATALEMVRELRRIIEGTVSTPPSKPTGPKPPPGPEAEGTEIVPGYRLVRRLGQGGYGTVWEAQAPGGKRVAIKVIHDVQGSSGRQEFRALELIKSLDHEHLLDLHAYWLKDKDGDVIPDEVRNQPNAPAAHTLVIATKLASKNLLQRLNECQREGHTGIPLSELLPYIRQAAQAIDFLNEPRHRFGDQVMSIQHRDIKPENILLVGKTAKVGDFGLAKVLEGTNGQIHGSSTGYTPHYAAPEFFNGQVTRWTDQYSLAITYFKLRTGRLPFEANISLGDLLMMHLEGHLDLSALSESERTIIARATSPDAARRYPTCLDMVNALERVLSGEIRQPKPPLAPTPAEISLPIPSPKPAASSKRPKPPSNPDGLTIRPEDEDGSVIVTTPEREEAAPGEDLVDWPVDTQESGHDTPVPGRESPSPSSWRPHGKEQDSRPIATPKPERATGKPAWNEGTGRQPGGKSKVPVGILVILLLVAGGGAGFAIWKLNTREGSNLVIVPNDTGRETARVASTSKRIDETKKGRNSKPTAIETSRAETTSRVIASTQKIDPIPALDPLAADRKTAEAFLKDHRQTVDSKDPKLLDQAFDALVQLPVRNKLRDDPAGKRLNKLGNDLAKRLEENVKAVIAKAPDEKTEQVAAALARAEKLVRYDPEQYGDFSAKMHQEAIVNLRKAAAEYPRKPNPNNPLVAPWDAKGAAQVCQWLVSGRDFLKATGNDLSPEEKQVLILAAGTKEPPDKALALALLKDVAPTENRAGLPYLLVQAQVQPDTLEGWKESLQTYVKIIARTKNEDKIIAFRYRNILTPAIKTGIKIVQEEEAAGRKLTPDLRYLLGDCYWAQAELFDAYPGMDFWPDDWKALKINDYKKAVRDRPEPERLLKVSEVLRDWALNHFDAKSSGQRTNLDDALGYAKKALLNKHPNPAVVYFQKGIILEDLARIFEERDQYAAAIQAFSDALEKGSLADDQKKVEAYFHLGVDSFKLGPTHYSRARSSLAETLHLIKLEGGSPEKIADSLALLQRIGNDEIVLLKEGKLKDDQADAQLAVDSCADLVKYSKKFKDYDCKFNGIKYKNNLYEFLGAEGLRIIGNYYILEKDYEKKRQPKLRPDRDPVKAFAVYNKELPPDLKDVDPMQIRLLTARAYLCLDFAPQLKPLKNFRDLNTLMQDAVKAVELADSNYQKTATFIGDDYAAVSRGEAYTLAVRCFSQAGKTDEAIHYAKQGLGKKLDTGAEKELEENLRNLKPGR